MSVSGNILFFTLGEHFKHFRLDTPISVKNGTNMMYIQDRRLSITIPKLFVYIGINQTPGYINNPKSTVLYCPASETPNSTANISSTASIKSTIVLQDEFIFQQMSLHDESTMLSTLCSTFYEEAKLPYDLFTITQEGDNSISEKTEYLRRTAEHFMNLTKELQ